MENLGLFSCVSSSMKGNSMEELFMVLFGHLCYSLFFLYGPIWAVILLYAVVWFCMLQLGFLWPWILFNSPSCCNNSSIRSCMAFYFAGWSLMVLYAPIWSCLVPVVLCGIVVFCCSCMFSVSCMFLFFCILQSCLLPYWYCLIPFCVVIWSCMPFMIPYSIVWF